MSSRARKTTTRKKSTARRGSSNSQPTGPKYPTIAQWAHKAIVPIQLDEDTKVDFRLPDLGVWIAQGRIPNPLKAIAEQIEFRAVNPEKLDDETRQRYYELRHFVIATHLVRPNLVDELGEKEAVRWVTEEMPPPHKDRLWFAGMHVLPPELSDALSSVMDLQPFRDEPAGPDAATDGGGDEQGAE